jgi:hypothetical protein
MKYVKDFSFTEQKTRFVVLRGDSAPSVVLRGDSAPSFMRSLKRNTADLFV